jgi:hypothetical protein
MKSLSQHILESINESVTIDKHSKTYKFLEEFVNYANGKLAKDTTISNIEALDSLGRFYSVNLSSPKHTLSVLVIREDDSDYDPHHLEYMIWFGRNRKFAKTKEAAIKIIAKIYKNFVNESLNDNVTEETETKTEQ